MSRRSITELLDSAIHEHVRSDEYGQGKFPLRPSSAGKCGRALAYELNEFLGKNKYEKKPIEPNVFRLLNLGHSIEYSALKNFALISGLEIKYKQQTVTLFELGERLIEGQLDAVFYYEGLRAIVDIKSQKDAFNVAYKTRWEETLAKYDASPYLEKIGDSEWFCEDLEGYVDTLGGDFFVDNLLQVNAYCNSDFAKERNIDTGIILKYNKNDSRQYAFQFKPSPALFERLRLKYSQIDRLVPVAGPEAIERDFNLGSMRCAFCPYQKECWDKDALKAWFQTFPKKDWPVRIEELPGELIGWFHDLEKADDAALKAGSERDQIVKYMVDNKIRKIRLANGHIYELRFYKSPKERFELKRSKL